ncbi:GPI transamidase component pig-S/T [Colletotrichum truncatum]|uniref:GPI transamidase component pig-S/T n=1 Tax=Colletotrichum truncatum TaxID=5467 RepID=A0ACC3ZIP1_COLTU|nr:GPI transamidase component pig-S/T [Colletotrichum truncatum]KAF6785606.1 GPI transamidase component pig-S/T [Colletotrichum truncatum]
MFSSLYWRKACVFTWLVCHHHLVSGLDFIPLIQSSPNFPNHEQSLTQRAASRPNASCPVDGQIACGNGTPDYFCCPSDKTCMVLASNTTALCCPKGASCEAISTIICDITAQDVVENPDSPIHTTKLDKSLPKCGNRCCPFGYKCQGDSVCVLEKDEGSRTSTSTNIIATKTKITFVSSLPSVGSSTQEAAETPTKSLAAIHQTTTPHVSRIQQLPTSSVTGPSEVATPAAVTSSEKTTSVGIIAGTTVAAIAAVAGLTCLLWFKRRSISKKVGSVKFPQPWQQLRENSSEQGVSLPRYNSPPPAYNMEMKQPAAHQYKFKHYSPDSVGSNAPVELPATPVSFSVWNPHSPRGVRAPRSYYEPYRRPG